MNCRECQNVLDDLLAATPSDAVYAELGDHVAACPECARERELAGRALAALAIPRPAPAAAGLKARILQEAAALAAADEARTVRRAPAWSLAPVPRRLAAIGLAAALLVVATAVVWRDRGERPPEASAFTLISQAYGAEQSIFLADGIVHIVNEIVVKPVADADLSGARWFPMMSLEATGKPRFHQLKLSAKAGESYVVTDECWYESATGRFVRQLRTGQTPIYANAFDGRAVYWLNVASDGSPQVEKRDTTADFRPPRAPKTCWASPPVCRPASTRRIRNMSSTPERRGWTTARWAAGCESAIRRRAATSRRPATPCSQFARTTRRSPGSNW